MRTLEGYLTQYTAFKKVVEWDFYNQKYQDLKEQLRKMYGSKELEEAKEELSKEALEILSKAQVDKERVAQLKGVIEKRQWLPLIVLNEKDSSQSFRLTEIEQKIADKTGVKTKLTISEEYTKNVGVIVKRIGGQIFVDNTFNVILGRYKKELKLTIARILFSDLN